MTGSPTAWKWVLAALCAAGLLAIALRAWRQNRPLLAEVREHDSLTLGVWLNTLRIWAPLGLVVLGLWLGARAVRDLGQSWLYRHTTLDEFCTLESSKQQLIIPCTDFDGRLPRAAVRRAGVAVDVSHHLFERYTAARERMLAKSAQELRFPAPGAFSPAAVLELPTRPPLDPELLALFTRRQQLLADPMRKLQATVGTILPQLQLGTGNQELASINRRISERLQQIHAQEFGGLSAEERARRYARNRVLIGLRRIDTPVAPLLFASDGESVPSPLFAESAAPDPDERVRLGITRSFADSEAAAYAVLSQQIRSAFEAEAAYPLLGMRRLCTVAASAGEADSGMNHGVFPCFDGDDASAEWQLRSLGFRDSVRHSIDRWRTQSRYDSHEKLAQLDRERAAAAIDAAQAAEKAAAAIPAGIHLGRQNCRLWHPLNCVLNELAAAAETALAQARNRAVAAATARATSGIDTGSRSAQQQIDAARLAAGPRIDALHAGARENIERWFDWMSILAALGYLLLGLIVVKSLLYVLALELFHKDSKLAISFDTPAQPEGEIVHGPMVVIDKAFPHALITKKQMGNTTSRLQFAAWPRVAPLLRILKRRYFFFNRGTFLASGETSAPGMVATAESPASVVLWKMAPGEEVVFDYKNFHGASENVSLHKELSLRLSTLLLGRWVYHYARCSEGAGEGILLLKARVQALDQQFVTAIPRARLISWDRHMRFKADSQRHPWRSLVNDFTLVRSLDPGLPPGKWVTAPEQAELGTFNRLVAFLKSVFSALF